MEGDYFSLEGGFIDSQGFDMELSEILKSLPTFKNGIQNNNTTLSDIVIFGIGVARFSGDVSDFYQDEEVISFYAKLVGLKEFCFLIIPLPLPFGDKIIPIPYCERYYELYVKEEVEIIKDDYIYQNYFFRCKDDYLKGIATYVKF